MKARAAGLIAAAFLLLGAESAGAFFLGMGIEPCVPGSMDPDCFLAPGSTVTVRVWLDTEGALNSNYRLMLLGVGVLFDSQLLEYDQAASSAASAALGVGAPGADLIPASTCPNTNPTYPTYGVYQCGLFALPPAQVELDFISSELASLRGVGTNSAPGGSLLATLVFRVTATDDVGPGAIGWVFSSARGGALTVQTRATSTSPWTYQDVTPSLGWVPEPATGLLLGLGLAGLGAARRGRG